MTTPRQGIYGPPNNLAARFEQKASKVQAVANGEPAKPRFNHSASSTSIGAARRTYDSKRNNLLSNYTSN